MRCLVTGGAGFIGSALIRRLASDGYHVCGIIHHAQPKFFHTNVEYVTGDITNQDFLKSVMNQVDVVFHCAAVVKDYGPKEEFYQINIEGTKNLVTACEGKSVKRLVYLSSNMSNESENKHSNYRKTKARAERFLLEKYSQDQLPVVIIRPGHVYGPGATTWVLRPLRAIQKNRITLIDSGNGIFLHTYIENLIDALLAAVDEPQVIGKTIVVTDGDNNTTWGEYLNALAKMAHKPPIHKNMSKRTALIVSKIMITTYKLFKIEPWVTPMAVEIFTNHQTVSIEQAKALLGYAPRINFIEGIKQVERWLKAEKYII
jgi:nucleoside-diphosphate-sugar epimerase